MEIVDLKQMPCFGVAGNFTGHLEQAGEASDFANVKTAETNAPKAIFPTYMPNGKNTVPQFLFTRLSVTSPAACALPARRHGAARPVRPPRRISALPSPAVAP